MPKPNRSKSHFDGLILNTDAILDQGDFGKAYLLFYQDVDIVNGLVGKEININDNFKLYTIAIGPVYMDFKE